MHSRRPFLNILLRKKKSLTVKMRKCIKHYTLAKFHGVPKLNFFFFNYSVLVLWIKNYNGAKFSAVYKKNNFLFQLSVVICVKNYTLATF